MRKLLLSSGMLLILIGLVLGTCLDWFANPEIASDAHVAGVQHGMLLLLLGLAWSYAQLGRMGATCVYLNILGLYGIWLAFLVGAVTGEPYPAASQVTENTFVVSSWALIVGVALYFYGLLRGSET